MKATIITHDHELDPGQVPGDVIGVIHDIASQICDTIPEYVSGTTYFWTFSPMLE